MSLTKFHKLSVLLFAWILLPAIALKAEPERKFDIVEVTEQELMAAAEQSGFGDPWLDDLHLAVLTAFRELEAGGAIAGEIRTSGDMFQDRAANRFVKLKDASGREYFRIYLGNDDSHNDIFAKHSYTYNVYGFFYPDGERKKLESVFFQIYRVNFVPGRPLFREMRRLVHPQPGILPVSVEDNPAVQDAASNDSLSVEYYASEEAPTPFVESVDGVPGPDISLQPRMVVKVKDPVEPLPYGNRVKMLDIYRRMMIKSAYFLKRELNIMNMKRPVQIERTLDITI